MGLWRRTWSKQLVVRIGREIEVDSRASTNPLSEDIPSGPGLSVNPSLRGPGLGITEDSQFFNRLSSWGSLVLNIPMFCNLSILSVTFFDTGALRHIRQ